MGTKPRALVTLREDLVCERGHTSVLKKVKGGDVLNKLVHAIRAYTKSLHDRRN